MTTAILVFLPFASPASPPYSLVYLEGFLKRNCGDLDVSLLDLNAKLHKKQFSEYYQGLKSCLQDKDLDSYRQVIARAHTEFGSFRDAENKKLRAQQDCFTLSFCLDEISRTGADVIILSVVYNSQVFIAQILARLLSGLGKRVFVGGPAVSEQLKALGCFARHEVELVELLRGESVDMGVLDCRRILDFSGLIVDDYFTSRLVIPLKSSSCCYYQQCAFCTHHQNAQYVEYCLDELKESILLSGAQEVFFIDDMISKKRLLEIAAVLKCVNVNWMCQLRPTKDFDFETLKCLYDAGLRQVIWGVESGSDRVLSLMRKGTVVEDMSRVLQLSHRVGITNVVYILFGFPGETRDEFLQTIEFLKEHSQFVSLVSSAVFGLQEGSPISQQASLFGVRVVRSVVREHLPPKLDYELDSGLSQLEAKLLKKKYAKTLSNFNSFPKEMNLFREHVLLFVSDNSNKDLNKT